jgi:SAM-dependent methyltransferase
MQVALEEALAELSGALADPAGLVRAIAAGRRRGGDPPRWRRVELRPVDLRAGRRLQIVRYDERQAFTENIEYGSGAVVAVKELLTEPFGSWHVDTPTDTIQLRVTKKGKAQLHRQASTAEAASSGMRPILRAHDRVKPRILAPDDPMLRAVGIATADGTVKAVKRDKYHQIEEFLRALQPLLPNLGRPTPTAAAPGGRDPAPAQPDRLADAGREVLRVADLGCGNAYLTFAAYTVLTRDGGAVELVGVDVKAQALERNAAIAAQLGWSDHIRFVEGAIDAATVEFTGGATPDLVLALHACDTATDDALARGVRWQAPAIMAAPCCHHDIQAQLRRAPPPQPYTLLTRHGILGERYADVLTDALRAAILRLAGYRVEVVEFVASRHTPRNVLIRAIRTGAAPAPDRAEEYAALVGAWGVRPRLAALLGDMLPLRPAV